MSCAIRMSMLKPPLTTIFGLMFIVLSILAIVENGFILFFIWKPGRKITSSIKILSSLAVSDLLVGMVLSPVTSWQILKHTSLSNCYVEYVRRYFTVLLVGSSVLTLGLVAFDRYISLTKLTNYNRYMNNRKLIFLITFAWLVPALIPILQKKIFGPYTYLSAVLVLFLVPLIFLVVFYNFIIQVVRRKERNLLNCHQKVFFIATNNAKEDWEIARAIQQRESLKAKKQLVVAKAVTILIVCYSLCIMPINTWIIVNILNSKYNFMNLKVHQTWYMVSMLAAECNSIINPVIYILKYPEFKKRLRILFKRKSQIFSGSSPSN